MSAVLRLDRVDKHHPGVHALRDVSLTVRAGDGLAIVGPSGSGKSTLLHLMGLLDRPTGGAVAIDGRDPAALSDAAVSRLRGRRIGFVFQQAHLLPRLTALENVVAGLRFAGVARADRRSRALAVLDRVGLAARAGHLPAALSGGERQRVGIARALANWPALLLADEPTGALDRATGQRVLALFQELHAEGTTLAVITHDPEVAAAFPRRLRIEDGRVTEEAA